MKNMEMSLLKTHIFLEKRRRSEHHYIKKRVGVRTQQHIHHAQTTQRTHTTQRYSNLKHKCVFDRRRSIHIDPKKLITREGGKQEG
jgi:hypothetical protein